jgi:hypothetical protein
LYQLRTHEEVRDTIAALPDVALAGYAEALGVMRLVPWNGAPYVKSKPEGNMRTLTFGPDGTGMVTYLILEDQQWVDVLRVQWLG